MKFIVLAKSNYGATFYYPANEAAKVICRIAGTKTLTLRVLDILSELGEVEVDGHATLRQIVNGVPYHVDSQDTTERNAEAAATSWQNNGVPA